MQLKSMAAVALASGVVSSSMAADAVQWRVEDGGNGHWYQLIVSGPISWEGARQACVTLGGHLATPRSAAEDSFVLSISNRASHPSAWVNDFGGNAAGPWLGGFQPPDADPGQPWAWVTGEPWVWSGWAPGEPNGGFIPGLQTTCMMGYAGSNFYRGWADISSNDIPPYPGSSAYIVEWSADCNNDGIVDYGQCRDGSLPDYNGTNIPDCCEQGTPCEAGRYPSQWKLSEGGNGHWYLLDGPFFTTWAKAKLYAEQRGGHLVTLTTVAEQEFASYLAFNSTPSAVDDCWLGGYQDLAAADYSEPGGGWRWVTGEEWSFTSWRPDGHPSGLGDFLVATTVPADQLGWVDSTPWHEPGNCQAFIEWSADCNNDGIVDYGQILEGTLADLAGDGVPDQCQGIITVPTDFPTLQSAVDSIPSGESRHVHLMPGLYQESVVVGAVGVHFMASGAGVVIQPPVGSRGIYFGGRSNLPCSVEGVAFTRSAEFGGGIEVVGRTVSVRGCAFDRCINAEGGAMRVLSGSVEIAQSTFVECVAVGPSGTWGSAGGVHNRSSTLTISGSTFLRCSGGGAEALTNESGTTYMTTCTVVGSPLDAYFGQIYNIGSLIVEDSAFRDSLKPAVFGWAGFTVRRCTFQDMSGYSVIDRRFGDYTVDSCDFLRCNTGGPLFMSFYNGRFLIGGCTFCQCTWTGPFVQGSWADLGGNVFGCPDVLHVPADFPTIQAAIDSVPAGAQRTVQVAAGTYNESFSLNGKNVVIRGAANNATILDGTGLAASIATFTGGEPATAGLESLVFRNAAVGSLIYKGALFKVGGAVYGRDSSAVIRNCRFEGNRSDYGGGAYLLYCNMLVEGCVFTGNTGIAQGGGLMVFGTTGTVRNCTFTGNQCGIAGVGGGSAFKAAGALLTGESVTFDGCTVTGNTAGVEGGAVEYYENVELNPGTLHIVNSTITGNRSGNGTPAGAGGVMIAGRMQSVVVHGGTTVCDNVPRNIEGPYFIAGAPTVCDCMADLSGDGAVNGGDLGLLLNAWGGTLPTGVGDVNHDGIVDGVDLAELLGNWGACN